MLGFIITVHGVSFSLLRRYFYNKDIICLKTVSMPSTTLTPNPNTQLPNLRWQTHFTKQKKQLRVGGREEKSLKCFGLYNVQNRKNKKLYSTHS